MALNDDLFLYTARLAANNPTLSAGNTSQAYQHGVAILSSINDVANTLNNNIPNISITTASGSALDALGANYGQTRNAGTNATALVTFAVPVTPTAGSPLVLSPGTVVSTSGDGVTTQAVAYVTTQTATITNPATTSNAVLATATVAGIIGNAATGTITTLVTAIGGGVSVTNTQAVDGTNNTVLGVDAQGDSQYRSSILANIAPKYGTTAITNAILAVSGVYAALVYDPGSVGTASNFIYYAWCKVDGTAPGVTGGGTASADSQTYLTTPSLTSTALAVDNAVRAVLPAGVQPRVYAVGSTTSPFTVTNLTVIPIVYSAATSVQSATIGPLIQAAVVAYVQSLQPNQALLPAPLFQYVQSYSGINGTLTNLNIGTVYTAIGATTPASTSAVPTTLYRSTGVASSVVTLTRI